MTLFPRRHAQRGRAFMPWLVTVLVVLLAGGVLYLAYRNSEQAQAQADAARKEAEAAATRARDAEAAKLAAEQKLAAADARDAAQHEQVHPAASSIACISSSEKPK